VNEFLLPDEASQLPEQGALKDFVPLYTDFLW